MLACSETGGTHGHQSPRAAEVAPAGRADPRQFRRRRFRHPRTQGRRVPVAHPLDVARSLHARPYGRDQGLRRKRQPGRRHGRRHSRPGREVQESPVQGRRLRRGIFRLAELRSVEWRHDDEAQSRHGTALDRALRTGHARHDGVVGPDADRQAQARRDRRRLGGIGCGRLGGRPARQAARLPRGGHRRRQGQVRLRGEGAGLRRLRRLPRGRRQPVQGAAGRGNPRASTSISRMSAARCRPPSCRSSTTSRACPCAG